jgi:cytochrome c oxidase assembly protein subunit 15
VFQRFLKLPIFSSARIPIYVWASLVSQILIVVTGAVVRLTGSGLGCPTWPKCTEESLVTVPEMGVHGIIEFGNRLLTFVLAIIAVLTFFTVVALGNQLRRGLFAPALILGLGIPAQAILGGFTVLFKLNPWFVGAHFVLSAYLIAVASVLVSRALPKKPEPATAAQKFIAAAIALFGGISILVGVLVTGAGPHSGDAESVRNGLDLELWQHLHSYPAYLTTTLVLLQLFSLRKVSQERSWQLRVNSMLFLALSLQAIIGVMQARLGVPPVLVALHMLGASIIVSLLVFQWRSIYVR